MGISYDLLAILAVVFVFVISSFKRIRFISASSVCALHGS